MTDPIPGTAPPRAIALSATAMIHSGGAERYTRDVVAGLHRRGIRPTLYARRIDPALPETAWVEARRIEVRWAPRAVRNLVYDWLLGRRLRRDLPGPVFAINHTRHADVALCGGTHPGFLATAGRAPRLADRLQIGLEQRTYSGARRIMAHSGRMAAELQRYYGIAAERITVAYPPADTGRFRPLSHDERMRVRQELGLPQDRAVFVFSSTSHERKGYPLLEALFASTELPVCLAVAGRPVPRTGPTIRELGYRSDIERVFAAADFTIVASAYEPFGLVGVESVLCGTPVIIADNVGSAEAITADGKIAFSRDDPAGLANAVDEALRRLATGRARIAEPRAALVYDPEVDAHVDALLDMLPNPPHAAR